MIIDYNILFTGQDQHIGAKEDLKLNLDPVSTDFQKEFVGLSTPPRVLTLEERPFPALEDPNESMAYKQDASFMGSQNGYVPTTPRGAR